MFWIVATLGRLRSSSLTNVAPSSCRQSTSSATGRIGYPIDVCFGGGCLRGLWGRVEADWGVREDEAYIARAGGASRADGRMVLRAQQAGWAGRRRDASRRCFLSGVTDFRSDPVWALALHLPGQLSLSRSSGRPALPRRRGLPPRPFLSWPAPAVSSHSVLERVPPLAWADLAPSPACAPSRPRQQPPPPACSRNGARILPSLATRDRNPSSPRQQPTTPSILDRHAHDRRTTRACHAAARGGRPPRARRTSRGRRRRRSPRVIGAVTCRPVTSHVVPHVVRQPSVGPGRLEHSLTGRLAASSNADDASLHHLAPPAHALPPAGVPPHCPRLLLLLASPSAGRPRARGRSVVR